MAKKEESLYEKHKRYHDIVTDFKKLRDDDHIQDLSARVHKHVNAFFEEHQKGGVVELDTVDEKKIKETADKAYDSAAEFILKEYYGLSEDTIKDLKKAKSRDGGGSALEKLLQSHIGTKEELRANMSSGKMEAGNLREFYVRQFPERHHRLRVSHFMNDRLTEPDDIKGVHAYAKEAKKHNKRSLRGMRVSPYKTLDEASGALIEIGSSVPDNYHPDKPDTHK